MATPQILDADSSGSLSFEELRGGLLRLRVSPAIAHAHAKRPARPELALRARACALFCCFEGRRSS